MNLTLKNNKNGVANIQGIYLFHTKKPILDFHQVRFQKEKANLSSLQYNDFVASFFYSRSIHICVHSDKTNME